MWHVEIYHNSNIAFFPLLFAKALCPQIFVIRTEMDPLFKKRGRNRMSTFSTNVCKRGKIDQVPGSIFRSVSSQGSLKFVVLRGLFFCEGNAKHCRGGSKKSFFCESRKLFSCWQHACIFLIKDFLSNGCRARERWWNIQDTSKSLELWLEKTSSRPNN